MCIRNLILFLVVVSLPVAAFGAGPGVNGDPATTTYTTSTQTIYDTAYATSSQQVYTYTTELIGRMQGGQELFDQSFNVAFTDPQVQTAIGTAEGVLTSNGATSFLGPNLLTTNTLFESSSSIGSPVVLSIKDTSSSTTYIGPLTIMTGDNQSTSTVISGGAMDVDTLYTTLINQVITTTVTDTYLTQTVYELDGVAPAATATPEPATMLLFGAGLAGLTGVVRRKKV